MNRGEILRLDDNTACIRCPQCPPPGESADDMDSCKLRLHMFVDHPESSAKAAYLQYYMINMILLATFKLIFYSVHEYSDWIGWTVIEIWICISFLVELIVRYVATHNRKTFWCNIYNIIDLLAVLPFFLQFVRNLDSFRVFRLLRVVRLFRLLKLSRHVKLWDILKATIDDCRTVLSLLWFVFAGVTIAMSTIVYNVELGMWDDSQNAYVNADGSLTQISSIPLGIYWCVQTLTGTAYGDVLTLNFFGKFFAIITMLLGITFLSLSAAVVTTSFANVYKNELNKQRRLADMMRANGASFDTSLDQGELKSIQTETVKKLQAVYDTVKSNGSLDPRRDKYWKATLTSIAAQMEALISDAAGDDKVKSPQTVAGGIVQLEETKAN